jgi:hypothetical protein
MELTRPTLFLDAVRELAQRDNLPNALSAEQLEELPVALRRRSFFSARVAEAEILDGMKARIGRLLGAGATGEPGDYFNPTVFRTELRELLDSVGYQPHPDDVGSIKDLRTESRLNLIVRTQEEMATGHGQFLQSTDPDTVDLWPAFELVRVQDSAAPRDWPQRWRDAAGRVGDTDALRMLGQHRRMIARKDSPIWTALSRFGRPHPPFDFNSGMDVVDVDRQECLDLGLIRPGDRIQPEDPGLPESAANVSAMDPEIRASLLASIGPEYYLDAEGVIRSRE